MATFKEAFRSARSSGKKEFTWNGKQYNTKLREDSKSVPTPTSRPVRKADTAKSGASRSTDNKVQRKTRERADYPKASRDVGVAKSGSKISKTVAKSENTPVKKESQNYPRDSRSVGIARKGSAISNAVARRENEPKRKK